MKRAGRRCLRARAEVELGACARLKESPPSCLRHRPSGLPFCLSAYLPPATALIFPPFSNGNCSEPCWGPSADSTLFLRGEFMDSRAAFVKLSSVGTQNYFFWLNDFLSRQLRHTSQPLLFLIVEEKPVSGSAPPSQRSLAQSEPARQRLFLRTRRR